MCNDLDPGTPESRRHVVSDSESETSDVPPELPPRTPNRTLSTVGGSSTLSNGDQRFLRTVSVISADAAATLPNSFATDQWNSGN